MTKILAMDTSHEICSVALNIDGQTTSRTSAEPRQHARQLMPMIEELLAERGVRIAELDGIALVIGPGSFTGLRIGAGVAQGLSFGSNVPVLSISSLAVMAMKAHLAHKCSHVNVCLQAREDEVYAASYRIDVDDVHVLGVEQVCAPDALQFDVLGVAAGNGWRMLSERQRIGEPILDCVSDAVTLSHIASSRLQKGPGLAAQDVLPVYLKEHMDYHT